jgi:hypothetical protein
MPNNTTLYEGRITSEVRVHLIDLLKMVSLANLGKGPNVKKVCIIAIEMLDNAQRYCSDGNVRFTWELEGGHLVITIENKATMTDAYRLLHMVEAVNSMPPSGIADAFRAQLTNGEYGEKGGAGLGLLDIARKIKGGIRAHIHPDRDENYFCRSQVSTQLH